MEYAFDQGDYENPVENEDEFIWAETGGHVFFFDQLFLDR